ncbi:TAXI family TRAP transporter solute-binding subunit [Pseudomonas sp. MYb185]|uniref:TAXI family TRAP transporter solute-binding subunit n=1 Tax=Pseudomonas sp. MYb185 TaxID=1848729 RepID=UPI000CFBFB95|nr:TAXI family TRAP transporter solute-binding subunit [Pseudomonas sp. MYb185]PRB82242.1 C4-dicarboxylate ABC transporter substrate-binding protein [Pseudomonas sp. MYb185]
MHVVKQAALFVRTNFWIVPLALLLAWALFRFLDPAPPRTLVMTTGGESGGYHHFGLALKQRLAEEGLTLELRTSSGSVDNLERLSDGSGAVQLGLIQSGTTSLIEPQRLAGLESLGAIYHEPLWLFQKRDAGIARLSDLRGRQISVGSAGSGTWAVVRSVFNQLDGQAGEDELANGNWRQLPDSASARALHAGELDAAFFVLPVDNAMVRQLLADPDLELVNLGQTEALAARLPFLEKLSVAEGLFDLQRNIPAERTELLSPVATLVINEAFHPALASLVLQATTDVLRQGSLLDPPGSFPAATPMELELSGEAEYYHERGVPFLQRYLPFWVASIVDRYVVLLIPFIAIMLPLVKSMGPLYAWRMRARVYRWYAHLRRVDKLIHNGGIHEVLGREIDALLALEDELTRVDVPLSYAHELYSLHLHVSYMISRLRQMQQENADAGYEAPAL